MRITNPLPGATIGLTTIMREAPVLELDAGFHPSLSVSDEPTFVPDPEALNDIHARMVIIIPCKDEEPETLLGVLRGIPHPCTILLVSASREYEAEVALLAEYCRPGRRRGLAIHQSDSGAACALAGAGMPSKFFIRGSVRAGKGEGMILGTAVALTLFPEMRYVGFLDADAKIPSAPTEYCRAYATGFALHHATADDDDVMVRIHWGSKPKARKDGTGGLDFGVAEGRSSRIVNEWMNRFVRAAGGGDEDKIVTTGNAGEHAMTMSLAKKLQLAGGYAIEPFHYVDLFIRQMRAAAEARSSPASSPSAPAYGDVVDELNTLHISVPMVRSSSNDSSGSSSGSGSGSWMNSSATSIRSMATSNSSADDLPLEESPVQVIQIKTINPHIHRETDDAHVRNMWKMGLGTLYHHLLPEYISSPHVQPDVRERMVQLRTDMRVFVEANNREIGEKTDPWELLPKPRVYPALETLEMEVLGERLGLCDSLKKFGF